MDLLLFINCSEQPIVRCFGNPEIFTDTYFLQVTFSAQQEKNQDYWHSLGFAKAFCFPRNDPYMSHSCPVDGCRGSYSPRAEYEEAREDHNNADYFDDIDFYEWDM